MQNPRIYETLERYIAQTTNLVTTVYRWMQQLF